MRLKLAMIAAVMVVASACSGTSNTPAQSTQADIDLTGPVAITLWHTQTGVNAKALQDSVDKFNQTNGKGITLTLQYQGSYTQLYQKTLSAIQAGALPELAVGYESFVSDYQKADVCLNLDPYVQSAKNGLSKASQDDIYKGYFDTNRFPQFGNQLLSFPFTKSHLITYQNDDILKEIGKPTPKTWDEFEATARAAVKKGPDGKPIRYGWSAVTSASIFNGWVLSRGGKLMADDNKTVAWDGKEAVEAVKLFDKLLKDGVAYVPKGFDYQTDFGSGRVLFVPESSSGRPFYKLSFKQPINWSITSIPQTDPAKPRTVQYGANIIVFKSTPEKQLASWLFVKWFTEKDQTADWAIKSGYMAVRKSAAETDILKASWGKDDPQGKQAFELIGTSIPEPNARGQQDIRTVIEDLLTAVAAGKVTDIDKAVKDAGAKANQILKDNQ
ncbi:MAG TPA: ABC transporter substrate-binding protein [Candidatus Limnocylindria bacterium]|nr:ABC transporter substrate-binding protein [Candidatus Limnocylindria bacterium]